MPSGLNSKLVGFYQANGFLFTPVEDTSISGEADSDNMLEEGPLEDSTREEGGFSIPPTDASFYSLQVRVKAVP